MGLFSRKNKNKENADNTQNAGNNRNIESGKRAETNEINNSELKTNIANTAMQLLVQGEDYDQLANTTCEFGYIFMIEGHGLEALLKITTDKKTCYFAAQKESLMRLNFNDALFKSTTEQFLSMHQ